ncbi:polyhomeotic-like protein 2 [Dermacentor albipictus]|uniref:polyhomeotic-like protein 2 n=1 Tax=Dermacentor albipictus TaxID=60249 RepID=UPI0031FBBA16
MDSMRRREKHRRGQRNETATTRGTVTRGTTRRRRGGRRHGPRVGSRMSAERWLSTLPPVTKVNLSELFDHVPKLSSQAGVMTHVIAGNVVQESTEPFSVGLWRRSSPDSGQATRHVFPELEVSRRASPEVPDPRPAFESKNDAPADVDLASNRDAAATTSAAAGESSFEHELAPSETLPPPTPCVASPKHDPAPTVVCACRRQPAAPEYCAPVLTSSSISASYPVPVPNVASHSARETTGCGDVAMEEMSASARFPTRIPAANAAWTTPAPNPAGQPASQAQDLAPLLQPSALPGKDPSSWTVDDVVQYISGLPGCERFAGVFREQEVDGRALLLLKSRHLHVNMKLRLGPALKILDDVRSLRGNLAQ